MKADYDCIIIGAGAAGIAAASYLKSGFKFSVLEAGTYWWTCLFFFVPVGRLP